MRVPICIFCKHCERMSLKNRHVTFIRRCTKHNTVVVSTTKECGDYEEDEATECIERPKSLGFDRRPEWPFGGDET